MKRSPILLLFSWMMFFSCNTSGKKNAVTEKENYEITKNNLRDKEIKSPQNFLFVSGVDKRNILGQMVVKGVIANKATVAIYKDVDVQLDFYSKTGALLETDKETIYEVIQPGESKKFKTKYFAPKGSDSVALKVLDAKVQEATK